MIQLEPIYQIMESGLLSGNGTWAGTSTRVLGDGRKIETLRAFASTSPLPVKKIVVLGQIHSANIAMTDPLWTGPLEKIEDTDGVICSEDDTLLVIRTADCIPMLFLDKKNHLIAASHQGWRGSLKSLPVKIIREMVGAGSSLADIRVMIGPGIGPCCYGVDDDRYMAFMEEFDSGFSRIFTRKKGIHHLNLLLLNYMLLVREGLRQDQIEFFPFCTSCDSSRFFSFRRDYKKNPSQFGEMFTFIIQKKTP